MIKYYEENNGLVYLNIYGFIVNLEMVLYIKVIPFELVYELEVVLLAEVNLDVSRLAKKSDFPLLIIIIY